MRESNRRLVRRALQVCMIVLVIGIVAPFVVTAVPQLVGMESSYVVTSGSMEPAIDVGAVILVERVDTSTLREGDVITFKRERGARPVTHRVVSVQGQGDDRSFLTKGDANEEPDREPIPASAVVGKVALVVPLIGYVVTYAQTDVGVILLVVLPGVALLSSELWRLHEIRRGSATDPHSADGDGGGSP